MARGDFPFNRLELNLQPIVARPRVRAEVGPLNDRRARHADQRYNLTAALDSASWGPSAGILLVLATVAAIAITNSPLGPAFEALWRQELGLSLGDAAFRRSILHWVNDGLLTVFFLVVGLEVKREMTVGHLASRRSAALPIAAALSGMVVPALLYALVIRAGRGHTDGASRWRRTPRSQLPWSP
jgi:hypothetical protein